MNDQSSELRVQSSERVRLDSVPGPVAELAKLQVSYGLPDEAFAKQVRLGYTGSTWGKIKAGTFDGNTEKALRAVRQALSAAREGLDPSEGRFVIFQHVKALLMSLKLARQELGPDRLVILAADMGMGKTEIAKYLERYEGAVRIDGRPSWSNSYMATLRDFADALGLGEEFRGVATLERAIEKELKLNPRLIVVDEANEFTGQGLDFIKYLLNRTRTVVVLLTLPEDYARWTATNRQKSRQLVRRSIVILRPSAVSPQDVASLQQAGWPELYLSPKALPKIAAAANRFAGLNLVARVLEDMDPAADDDAEDALERVLTMLEKDGAR